MKRSLTSNINPSFIFMIVTPGAQLSIPLIIDSTISKHTLKW